MSGIYSSWKFDKFMLVSNPDFRRDSHISVGLGDPKGCKHTLSEISTLISLHRAFLCHTLRQVRPIRGVRDFNKH